VPATHLDDVFREGFSTKQPGSAVNHGVGLALVAQVARRYGGTATVTNAPDGRGATFVVTLPTMLAPVMVDQ
jgi:two-component system, CitB family, sensor kinase